MAVLGLSKLEAVQQMAEQAGIKRPAALAPGTATPAGMAENVLDDVTLEFQEKGQADNVDRFQTLTASASAITLPSNTLSVVPCGKSEGRPYVARGDTLYDTIAGTSVFTNGETVQLHITRELTWDQLTPIAKRAIASEAIRRFQQIHRGNPQADAELAERVIASEAAVIAEKRDPGNMDKRPVFAQAQQRAQEPQR